MAEGSLSMALAARESWGTAIVGAGPPGLTAPTYPCDRFDVSVVVVSHESRNVIGRCLAAVSGTCLEVIVADSGSSDGSTALVEETHPDVRLLRITRNVGFGAAANAAIRLARGRYVLLLNADAWPLSGSIERLVEFAERTPKAGIVGPALYDLDGRPQRSVISHPANGLELALVTAFPVAASRICSAWHLLALGGADRGRRGFAVRGREFLMGAALLLRVEALRNVAGFDEGFFMYDEDVDLCHRMRAAGWTIEFVPAARFAHAGGASTRQRPEEMQRELFRSHIRIERKRHGPRATERARLLIAAALRFRALRLKGEARRAVERTASWLASSDAAAILSEERP